MPEFAIPSSSIHKGAELVPDSRIESPFSPYAISPLAGLSAPTAGVSLVERSSIGKINLRGSADDEGFLSSALSGLGVELPLEPNSVREMDDGRVFWLGPSEWLIHCPLANRRQRQTVLGNALQAVHHAVVDVSDYYVLMRLSGPAARTILTKGSPLDMDVAAFPEGRCAQTRYGHASVLLHAVDVVPSFDIQVRWSFAEYLWRYLVDGAKEFG